MPIAHRSAVSRRSLLRAAAGVGVLAAGGCGSSNSETPSGNGPVTELAGGTPQRGGRLRFAFVGGSTESRNVLAATATAVDYVRARIVYDTLGEFIDGTPQWRVAESVEPNRDATEWTIRVRDGITFADGRPLTATDVAFTLRSFLTTATLVAALLADVDPAALEVRDPRTLVVGLRRPHALFDLVLCQSVFVFPDGTTDFTTAPGSGPYQIKEYAAGRSSLLVPNNSYWDSDNGGPYLDELELMSVNDSNARLNGIKADQFDYAAALSLAAARSEAGNGDLQLIIPAKHNWIDLIFTMNRSLSPFTEAKVVQAMKLAVDRDAMARTVTMGLGEAGRDMIGQDDPMAADLPMPAHDPEQARRLLAEAGQDGLAVTLRTSDYEYGMLEGATAFVEQARAAGITVTLDRIPAADYFADPTVLTSTPFQTVALHPHALPLMMLSYYGSEALVPFTGATDAQVDELLTRMRTTVDPAARGAVIKETHRYLATNGGDLVYARVPSVSAARGNVRGVEDRGWAEYPSLRNAFSAA